MKRTIEELKGIDVALHAKVCIKYFQFVIVKSDSSEEGIKGAMSLIYEGTCFSSCFIFGFSHFLLF
jgi:hypothetical protein